MEERGAAGRAGGAGTGPARRVSRTDRVVNGVMQQILDGELAPGDRLPVEQDLAQRFGVSRGSLREGVRALAALGVVESRQGAGTYVTSLDSSLLVGPVGLLMELQGAGQAVHVHAVRRLLETEAAGLAARRAPAEFEPGARAALDAAAALLAAAAGAETDHEGLIEADIAFHRTVARASGNPVLAALVEALAGRTSRHRLRRGRTEEGAAERSHTEHEAIFAAVVAGDPDRARVRMSAHLLEVEDFLRTRAAP
ncbi:FadR/GntR family transcriptional regulator [Georgenia sp. SYP-B2076]|uniref:FadR/GntR family transcriptional regulator n=1 Tax=Georgenia sp. SYP-B2076 TaxID=2495881 RepID=UPI001F0C2242|nr:FadR/GntR family transcriptional regulator [Georgenia sp. SYP-B2076]